jgi:hypothetical protein
MNVPWGPDSRPVAHRLAQRAQHELGDARRARNAIDHHHELRLPWREQLRLGVGRAPLNFKLLRQRLGHAHQAMALRALFLAEGHVEHKALIELAAEDLDLALAAGAGAAVVRQGVSGAFQRHQHSVSACARHRPA